MWAFFGAFIESFPAVGTVVLLMVGALRLKGGAITPGDLVTVTYLLSLLAIPMRLMGWVFWDLAHSLAGWRRVEAVLTVDDFVVHGDLAAEPRGRPGRRWTAPVWASRYTPGEVVLAGVELDIPPGRTVAVVGPTGSGKSTLAMLLVRLWDPETGAITLDGRDLRRFARAELPREVAFVPQEAFLFNDDVTEEHHPGDGHPRGAAWWRRCGSPAPRASSANCRKGWPPASGSGAPRCPGGSASGWPWPGPWPAGRACWCSTTPPRRWIPRWRPRSCGGCREAELPSTVVVVAYRPSSIALADSVIYLDGGRVVAHGRHADLLATRARLCPPAAGLRGRRRRPPRREGARRRGGRRDDDARRPDPDTPAIGARAGVWAGPCARPRPCCAASR